MTYRVKLNKKSSNRLREKLTGYEVKKDQINADLDLEFKAWEKASDEDFAKFCRKYKV